MEGEKENDPVNTSIAPFSTPNTQFKSTPNGQLKNTPIRPLTAAYMAARNENEVMHNILPVLSIDQKIREQNSIQVRY